MKQHQQQCIRPVVLVPTHRSRPTPQEAISLRQLARNLGQHEIVLMTPEGLDTSAHRELLPNASHIAIKKEWMQSHASYNRLIISPLLGSLFRGYSHLLLHEPDSLALHDSLLKWCEQPYDYIGAPWFTPIAGKQGMATLRSRCQFRFFPVSTGCHAQSQPFLETLVPSEARPRRHPAWAERSAPAYRKRIEWPLSGWLAARRPSAVFLLL